MDLELAYFESLLNEWVVVTPCSKVMQCEQVAGRLKGVSERGIILELPTGTMYLTWRFIMAMVTVSPDDRDELTLKAMEIADLQRRPQA